MIVRDIMTHAPVCCLTTDSAQKVAGILHQQNVGSIPVVNDEASRKLIGIITDRDLCCSVVAKGLDPASTSIERFISRNPAACRENEELEHCERLMRERQVRRIPVVDNNGGVIGIVSQADLALKDEPQRVARMVAAISKPPSSVSV